LIWRAGSSSTDAAVSAGKTGLRVTEAAKPRPTV